MKSPKQTGNNGSGQAPYSYIWWILDPTHTNHCDDCKRMAAKSPFTPPWDSTNPLHQTPGDGFTSCEAHCTCILSYAPPGVNNPDMIQFQSPDHLSLLLQTYTHGQVRFIEEYGLEATNGQIAVRGQIEALVLTDSRLIKPSEYQLFRTGKDNTSVQLWEYPRELPFPPSKKALSNIEDTFRLVTEWPVVQIRWVFNPEALRRYEVTAPDIPEWDEDEDG